MDVSAFSNQPNEADDPFTKLHKFMELNFASIKSDTHVMSGQLGMLQSNVSNLDTTVKTMKSDFDGLNIRLTNVTVQAVANKCGISNINKQRKEMQSKQRADIDARLAAAVAKEVERVSVPDDMSCRLDKLDKELDRMKVLQMVQQMSTGQRRMTQRTGSSVAEDESQQYWATRKKIRCSPVEMGKDETETINNAYRFLECVLAMPKEEIPEGTIVGDKKVPWRKPNATQKEVVVSFDRVHARDCVASYAPNLADWRGQNAARAGLLGNPRLSVWCLQGVGKTCTPVKRTTSKLLQTQQ